MISPLRLAAVAVCALALTGCVSREQADQKLAKACEAGVRAMSFDGEDIGNVTNSKFSASVEGQGMRHVALTIERQDGWIEDNTIYECTFQEDFGLFNGNHTASLHNMKVGDQSYGRFGNQLLGDAQDFMKLTNAIRKSLYE